MNTERILNFIGVGLLLACFAVAASRIFSRGAEQLDPDAMQIRIAHHYLDPRVQRAFDAVIERYESIQAERGNPVSVMQIPVPERVYMQWVRTQVTGGTAPELINLEGAGGWTIDSLFKAQNLIVFDTLIDDPNPYNAGTMHAGKPWRESFIDALDVGGFDWALAQHFGVPLNSQTTRLVVNRNLLDKVLPEIRDPKTADTIAQTGAPQSFDQLIDLCRAAAAYGDKAGIEFFPIAADRMSVQSDGTLFHGLFTSQTQRLRFLWDQFNDYRIHGRWIQLQIFKGERSFRQPYFENAYRIIREIGQFTQPGFLQMNSEDALFYFVQNRALMISTSSQNLSLLNEMIGDRFSVSAFPVPLPDPDHPQFGAGLVGKPISERAASPTTTFGIVNYHPQDKIARALDFLHYITSIEGNDIFAEISQSLPATLGVPVPDPLKGFDPVREGYPRGPDPGIAGESPDWDSFLRSNFYILFSPEGSVDAFLDRIEADHIEVLYRDWWRNNENEAKTAMAQDSVLASYLWKQYMGLGDVPKARRQINFLLDAGDYREVRVHYFRKQAELLRAEGKLP